jgi:hypothetical protein
VSVEFPGRRGRLVHVSGALLLGQRTEQRHRWKPKPEPGPRGLDRRQPQRLCGVEQRSPQGRQRRGLQAPGERWQGMAQRHQPVSLARRY